MTRITASQAQALMTLVCELRPDWTREAVQENLLKIAHGMTVGALCVHAVRVAADHGNRAPVTLLHPAPTASSPAPAATPMLPWQRPTASGPEHVDRMRCRDCGMLRVRGESHVCSHIPAPDEVHRLAAAARAAIRTPPPDPEPEVDNRTLAMPPGDR